MGNEEAKRYDRSPSFIKTEGMGIPLFESQPSILQAPNQLVARNIMPGIKTAFRCKIGAHLVYPIKFGGIQSSIEPATTLYDIGVMFFDYKAPKQGEHRAAYPIAEIRFDPRNPNEREIMVRPIPKDLFPQLKERTIELFKGMVKDWLVSKRPLGWDMRTHALWISFDSKENLFVCHEHDTA